MLAILGGILLVIGLAQITVFIMSVIYLDDPSWFMLPTAVVMIVGTIVQAFFTGIWAVSLISLFPQFLILAAFAYSGYVLYGTANPLKIAVHTITGSWNKSFLAARIMGLWDKAVDHVKSLYWAGVNAGARLRGA